MTVADMTETSALATKCKESLEEMMAETNGMILGMIATSDGFVVASVTAPGREVDASRIAAMASSGHALGETVANELAHGKCNNVIIDTDQLSIVFLSVPDTVEPPLILGVAATKSVSLGTVIYGAKNCTKHLAESVTSGRSNTHSSRGSLLSTTR